MPLYNAVLHVKFTRAREVNSTFRRGKTLAHFSRVHVDSALSKIMLKILHGRMTKKIDEFLSDSQFGFRSERGTRDATPIRQFIEG